MASSSAYSGGFFDLAPDLSSGFTPYLNGSLDDANPFEAQYEEAFDIQGTIQPQSISWNSNSAASGHSPGLPRDYSQDCSESPTSGKDSTSAPASSAQRNVKRGKTTARPDAELAKRSKFLARNRLAASKCRTKKKEWTNNLEAAARQASLQSRELQAIVQRLRDEVVEYKTQLMSHHGCDCEQIRQYIQAEQSKNYSSAMSYAADGDQMRLN